MPRPIQLQLIDARPFRTAKQRLEYIRATIDQVRRERAAKRAYRRSRRISAPVDSTCLFR